MKNAIAKKSGAGKKEKSGAGKKEKSGAGKKKKLAKIGKCLVCELYKIILLYNSVRTGQFLGHMAKTASDKKPRSKFF